MRSTFLYILTVAAVVVSCGETDLEAKKEELAGYKNEVKELNSKIAKLQKEIAKIDTTFDQSQENAVLVNAKPAEVLDFTHKIEVRGEAESRRNVLLSSEIGGRIQSVEVSEGQNVKKGQVLMQLDADIIRNNIAELKTSLRLAETMYERQSNLWEQNIGTEIQYLEAKNRKESLERKLATAYSQLDQAIIKAPFNGTVDQIPARMGELAQPGMPLIRIVSPEAMYIQADVSERFIGDFKMGDPVELHFPIMDQTISSRISSVSDVINEDNRTFSVEVNLPDLDFPVKPNQVVILELVDYKKEDAIVVPTEVIMSDKDGKYLYTAVKGNGTTLAKKKRIEIGKAQNGKTEVISGIQPTDLVIIAGHRDLSDGIEIKAVERTTETAHL